MRRRSVLGIDAAWTDRQPSGVALAVAYDEGWRLAAAAPAYAHFHALSAGQSLETRPGGGLPDAVQLLASATAIAGTAPTLVTIDMPLATHRIEGRREADNAVSRHYGGRKCGTHSPSAERPGPISDALTRDFAAAGYPLLTSEIDRPGVIEVYPHPALVELMPAPERLPYKAAKTKTYWPDERELIDRIGLLEATWDTIAVMLDRHIAGAAAAFAATASLSRKAREDMLDAMICCVVGISALDGHARAFGDADAAIWVPLN